MLPRHSAPFANAETVHRRSKPFGTSSASESTNVPRLAQFGQHRCFASPSLSSRIFTMRLPSATATTFSAGGFKIVRFPEGLRSPAYERRSTLVGEARSDCFFSFAATDVCHERSSAGLGAAAGAAAGGAAGDGAAAAGAAAGDATRGSEPPTVRLRAALPGIPRNAKPTTTSEKYSGTNDGLVGKAGLR